MERADAVIYSTPDLREHVERLTNRGIYMPVTVRLNEAPVWSPTPGRVVFASRWDPVKGAEQQIAVAHALRKAAPDAEILGLNWGSDVASAQAAGVTLVPRMDYDSYRSWLASASVVVGQLAPILSASELEALAIGVPLLGGASSSFYPDLIRLSGTTSDEIVEGVLLAIADPQGASAAQRGRDYIAAVHDAGRGVEFLLELYEALIEGSTA
ncbi:hypothetical protein ASH00_14370 [Arthrobacter sp. Soil782]|nr:hypothetical protein ASH00_14370 [Arthrobacter sp. Soil782]